MGYFKTNLFVLLLSCLCSDPIGGPYISFPSNNQFIIFLNPYFSSINSKYKTILNKFIIIFFHFDKQRKKNTSTITVCSVDAFVHSML